MLQGSACSPEQKKLKATFTEEGFYSETEVGKTEWNYDRVLILAEIKDYFKLREIL